MARSGTIETWRPKGKSNLEFLSEDDFIKEQGELLDLVSYPKVCFGVMKRSSDGLLVGVIIEHSWNPQPYAYCNYTYCIQEEGDMPSGQPSFIYRCPERILAQLSTPEELYGEDHPIQMDWSKNWRSKCHRLAEETEAKPKPKAGQTVLFDRPIHFSDGEILGEMIYMGRNKFRHPHKDNWHCRLPHWRERKYQILQEDKEGSSALERLLIKKPLDQH